MLKKAFLIIHFLASLHLLFAKSMEVTPTIGKNFPHNSEVLKDAFSLGIRVNQYVSPSSGIRLGFDEIINANFKNGYRLENKSTNISRYSIGALHDFRFGNSPFIPYIFGGFGYEKVSNETQNYEFISQTFADAGAGMKFNINDKYSVVTEASAVKKLYDKTLDYTFSMGIGYKLNNTLLDPAPAKPVKHIKKKTSYTTGSFYKKKIDQIKKERIKQKTLLKKEQTPTIQTAIEKIKPKTTKKEDQNTTIVKTQKVTKPKAKPKIVTIKKQKDKQLSKGVYFIQMAAAFRTSIQKGEKKIIKKLKSINEPYEIEKTTLKSVPLQRLLAGSYDSFKVAKSKLKKLKKINPKAFIRYIKQ